MTQIGEGVATPPPEPVVEDDGKKHIDIRVDIFTDGTLNNRANIDARLVTALEAEKADAGPTLAPLTAEERRAAEELVAKMSSSDRKAATEAYRRHGAPPPSEDENSYEGFYSNVAKMEPHVLIGRGEQNGKPLFRFATYVEGVGTENEQADQLPGYAFGTSFLHWRAGILEKVEKAVADVVNKISKRLEGEKANVVIDGITIAVYGFSRGAAGARKLIHDLLFGRRFQEESLKGRLREQGYTAIATEVCFAGLYDTVSTYGGSLSGVVDVARGNADNVRELDLHAVYHAKRVLHLTAADEHRFHFSLTNIRSAGGRGQEFFLPGAHSDVGGGYRDASPERHVLRDTRRAYGVELQGRCETLEAAEADRQRLIEAGWYHPHEIHAAPIENGAGARVWATRASLANGYSKIPLNIMARVAKEEGLTLKDSFQKDQAVPPELHDVQDHIERYIATTTHSRPEDWQHNAPWLKKLRHDYLHFSARMQVGHDPRIVNGQRQRMTYDG